MWLSIKTKLTMGMLGILTIALFVVLYSFAHQYVNEVVELAYKAAINEVETPGKRFEDHVSSTIEKARAWVLSNPNQDISQLLQGDPSIVSVQVFSLDSKEAMRFGYHSDLKSIPPYLESDRENVLKEGKAVYEVVNLAQKKFHKIVAPIAREGDHLKQYLVILLSDAQAKTNFEFNDYVDFFIFKNNGTVLYNSQELDAILPDNKVPEYILKAVKTKIGYATLMSEKLNEPGLWQKVLRWVHPDLLHARTGNSKTLVFYKTSVQNITFATLTSNDSFIEPIFSNTKENILFILAVLGFAITCIALFSRSLTKPIDLLLQATNRISQEDFTVQVDVKTRDEIGSLAKAFNDMVKGLRERNKFKNILGKFHSKAVMQKLVNENQIQLGGETVYATVLFADIRSFTSISENKKPDQVVEMLNEYLTRMEEIISSNGGTVDKFVGDAIVAFWGIPATTPQDDATNALQAALNMRKALEELNAEKKARGEDIIEIGIGINSGEVIAGNIGSSSRMDYTIIGDAVNTASRIENFTKTNLQDILISDSTYKLVSKEFQFTKPSVVELRGKRRSIQVYGIAGSPAMRGSSVSNLPRPKLEQESTVSKEFQSVVEPTIIMPEELPKGHASVAIDFTSSMPFPEEVPKVKSLSSSHMKVVEQDEEELTSIVQQKVSGDIQPTVILQAPKTEEPSVPPPIPIKGRKKAS